MKSFLGGAAPRYQAHESSLLLMQAKCLACCPYTAFSITQSVHRHSEGLLIRQGMEVQGVIWGNRRSPSVNAPRQSRTGEKRGLPPPYLAFAAHFVALSQALLLGGAGGVPELDEVAQGDVQRAVGLQPACGGGRRGTREGSEVEDRGVRAERGGRGTHL